MNSLQKLYEEKYNNSEYEQRVAQMDYFKNLNQISTRKNNYIIPPKKITLRRNLCEPYKDPIVINSNKVFQIKLDTMIEEPTFPKLNTEYLEMRKKLKMNRDTYWDISKRVLTEENEKFQDRIFNQKPRIESTELLLKDYERSLVYKNIGRNRSRGIKRYFKEKSQQLILPSINKNKNKNKIRFDKIFQTEIENSNNSKDSIEKEKNNNNDVKLNEHKYDEISHQKQGHLEG
jgi:hypothetical protein